MATKLQTVIASVGALIVIVKDLINTPSTAQKELDELKVRSKQEIEDLRAQLAEEQADNADIAALEDLIPSINEAIDLAAATKTPGEVSTEPGTNPTSTENAINRPPDGAGGTNEVTPDPAGTVHATNPATGETLADPVTGQNPPAAPQED